MFGNRVYSAYTDIEKKKIGIPNPNGHYDPKLPLPLILRVLFKEGSHEFFLMVCSEIVCIVIILIKERKKLELFTLMVIMALKYPLPLILRMLFKEGFHDFFLMVCSEIVYTVIILI